MTTCRLLTPGLRSFDALSQSEREQLFQLANRWDPDRYDDLVDMSANYDSLAFEGGRQLFTLWNGKELVASLGLITKELQIKGEAFVTSLYGDDREALDALLTHARSLIPPTRHVLIHLSQAPSARHLNPWALAHGFEPECSSLVLARQATSLPTRHRMTSELLPLSTEAEIHAYCDTSNAAFLDSPMGGQLSPTEVRKMKEEAQDLDLLGVAYLHGKPFGIYNLDLKGSVGWIEGIGIAPTYRGKGLGAELLTRCMQVLKSKGATSFKLVVMSHNVAACKLYERTGFTLEKTLGHWYLARS